VTVRGMNTEQVRSFGTHLQNSTVSEFEGVLNTINQHVQNLDWRGTDADQFKTTEFQHVHQLFNQFRTGLQEMAQTAIRNADAQEQTSHQS